METATPLVIVIGFILALIATLVMWEFKSVQSERDNALQRADQLSDQLAAQNAVINEQKQRIIQSQAQAVKIRAEAYKKIEAIKLGSVPKDCVEAVKWAVSAIK